MRKIRLRSSNKTAYYIIAILVILLAFILLGGGNWVKGSGGSGMAGLQWVQIIISLIIGFFLGWVASKRKW
jgi:uncharacterized membrane protein